MEWNECRATHGSFRGSFRGSLRAFYLFIQVDYYDEDSRSLNLTRVDTGVTLDEAYEEMYVYYERKPLSKVRLKSFGSKKATVLNVGYSVNVQVLEDDGEFALDENGDNWLMDVQKYQISYDRQVGDAAEATRSLVCSD